MARQRVLLHHDVQIRPVCHPGPSVIDSINLVKVFDACLRRVRRRMTGINTVDAGTIDRIVKTVKTWVSSGTLESLRHGSLLRNIDSQA